MTQKELETVWTYAEEAGGMREFLIKKLVEEYRSQKDRIVCWACGETDCVERSQRGYTCQRVRI